MPPAEQSPALSSPSGAVLQERPLARDWFMIGTYALVGLTAITQIFLLAWLNLF